MGDGGLGHGGRGGAQLRIGEKKCAMGLCKRDQIIQGLAVVVQATEGRRRRSKVKPVGRCENSKHHSNIIQTSFKHQKTERKNFQHDHIEKAAMWNYRNRARMRELRHADDQRTSGGELYNDDWSISL